ncbi:Bis(5'-nucleosyl)-tetraphosphatase [Sergentomyia squamirostris]
MGKEFAAGLFIFRRISSQIEYLLLKASYGTHWTPPKGHLDPGETDFEAALRETKEEAGYSPEDLKIYKEHSYELNYVVKTRGGRPDEVSDKRVTYWLAELRDPEKKPQLSDEHVELKWLQKDEAVALAGFADYAGMMKKFHEIIMEKLN